MDVGSGTGLVPLQIGKFLKEGDLLICSDISAEILNICKKNLAKNNLKCQTKFLKIDGKKYEIKSESINFITLNSVLHHIPNFSTFFKELNRILKLNGYIIIGHEPNKLFTKNKFLWYNFRILFLLFNPRLLIINILKKMKLLK